MTRGVTGNPEGGAAAGGVPGEVGSATPGWLVPVAYGGEVTASKLWVRPLGTGLAAEPADRT
jgi:hypothetical protein